MLNRKEFIKTSSIALTSLAAGCAGNGNFDKIEKSLRLEMINVKASLESRLMLARQAGFDGIEVNSQGYERTEMLKALQKTNMKVSTVYHSDNWVYSLSSLDEKSRQKAVSSVISSVKAADLYDADFVQLLPGKEIEQHGEKGIKSLLNSLQQITSQLNGKLRLLLQNFPLKVLNEPKMFEAIFSRCDNSKVGLCLDTELASREGRLERWTDLLKKYFAKVDLDQNNFANVRSLLTEAHKVECLSPDVAGGKAERISSLQKQICLS